MATATTSRQRWVTTTRQATCRALAAERGVPMSATALEGNLDCSGYISGFGFTGVRTAREISAALRWLADRGLATRLPDAERDPEDPPGVLYAATLEGMAVAAGTAPWPEG